MRFQLPAVIVAVGATMFAVLPHRRCGGGTHLEASLRVGSTYPNARGHPGYNSGGMMGRRHFRMDVRRLSRCPGRR